MVVKPVDRRGLPFIKTTRLPVSIKLTVPVIVTERLELTVRVAWSGHIPSFGVPLLHTVHTFQHNIWSTIAALITLYTVTVRVSLGDFAAPFAKPFHSIHIVN